MSGKHALFIAAVAMLSLCCQVALAGDATQPGVEQLLLDLQDHSKRDAAMAALAKLGKPALPGLVRALRDQRETVRRDAADILRRMGPPAVEAIPALIQAITDEEKRQRGEHPSHRRGFHAGEVALLKVGLCSKAAAPVLIRLLEGGTWTDAISDRDWDMLVTVTGALREIGPDAREAVPALTRLLRSRIEGVRDVAADALGGIGPEAAAAAPALVEALGRANPRHVAAALVSLGKGAVPALAAASADKDPTTRQRAAEVLADIGPQASAGAPALVKTLRDPERLVRWRAAQALGKIGSHEPEAVAGLKARFDDPDGLVRVAAAEALSRLEPAATDEAVRVLIAVGTSYEAVDALGAIGPRAKAASATLAAALSSGSPDMRRHAAHALGAIGPGAKEAVPALRTVLSDEWLCVRVAAAAALTRIDPGAQEVGVPVLFAALRDAGREGKEAAEALAGVGRPAIPVLVKALAEPDRWTRMNGALGLGQMGPLAREAVPALVESLQDRVRDPDKWAGWTVAQALGKIGPDAKAAVPALVALLPNRYQLGGAAEALARIDPAQNAKSIPFLVKALEGRNAWEPEDAAKALGAIGPEAKEALPALGELRYHTERSVRAAAAKAIARILDQPSGASHD